MLRRIQSGLVRLHRDRRGASQSVEVLMCVAIALMVCLGVSQVAGVGIGGAEDSGLFKGIGSVLDSLDLGQFLPF